MNIEKIVNVLSEEFPAMLFVAEITKERLKILHNNQYYGLYAEIEERIVFMNKIVEICKANIDEDNKINICISFSDELPNLVTMVV